MNFWLEISDLALHTMNHLLIFIALLPGIHAACIDGCLCEDNLCTSCNEKSNNNNLQCVKCPQGCRSCFYNNTCTECINNNALYSGRCILCSPKCDSCDPIWPVLCYKCQNGFYFNELTYLCTSCPENCVSCTSFDNCKSCRSDYYGQTCKMTCSKGCIENTCDKHSGHCSCKDGWHGELCDATCPENCKNCSTSTLCFECKPGYYGNTCQRRCSAGCPDSPCNKDTGTCSSWPCRKTFSGENCDYCGSFGEHCMKNCPQNCRFCYLNTTCIICAETFFGDTCERRCSDRCTLNKCYGSSGTCSSCKQYFTGQWCENCLNDSVCNNNCPPNCLSCSSQNYCFDCKSGYYGDTCQLKCSLGCWNDLCSKENGRCEYSWIGCKDGFEGDSCQNCVKGKYGVYCLDECPSACAGNVCEKTTGNCLKGCISAMYGRKCEHYCPDNCKQCISNTSCNECDSGFWGDLCKLNCSEGCLEDCSDNGTCTDCKRGYYGNFCNVSCNENCFSGQCNGTGVCLECLNGYFGEQCEQICPPDCCNFTCYRNGSCEMCTNIDCPVHCLSARCSQSGSCIDCVNGFFGERCEITCSSDCCNGTCYRNGSCNVCTNKSNEKETGYYIERLGWFAFTGLFALTTLVLTISFLFFKRRLAQRNGSNVKSAQTNRSDGSASERSVSSVQNEQSAGYETPINNRSFHDPSNNGSSIHIYSDIYDMLLNEGNDLISCDGKDDISIPANGNQYESSLIEEAFGMCNMKKSNDDITLHADNASYERPFNEGTTNNEDGKESISTSDFSESYANQSEGEMPENESAHAGEQGTYLTPVA